MIKDIADPMFKTMLPSPLASLHFTKVGLGNVPMVFSNVQVTKTDTNGLMLDLNVDWDGKCDIELDGDMIPTIVSRTSCPTLMHRLDARTHSFDRESKVSNFMANSPFCYVLSQTSFRWYVICHIDRNNRPILCFC
jgi:hypothetical protein